MSKLHTVAVTLLVGALLLLTFLITTNGTLLPFFLGVIETTPFTNFGVLFATLSNYSLYYIDQEWLVLNDARLTTPRLLSADVDDLGADNKQRLGADADASRRLGFDHSKRLGGDDSPFNHDFPYYSWHGPVPRHSLKAGMDRASQSLHLFSTSSEKGQIEILYVCPVTADEAPKVVETAVFRGDLQNPRAVQIYESTLTNDRNQNLTFISFLADAEGQSQLYLGAVVRSDWLLTLDCYDPQTTIQHMMWIPIVQYKLGNCGNPKSFAMVKPSGSLVHEYMPDTHRSHHLFWVVCSGFFRIIRLSVPLPPEVFPTYTPPPEERKRAVPILEGRQLEGRPSLERQAPRQQPRERQLLGEESEEDGSHASTTEADSTTSTLASTIEAVFVDWTTGDNENVTIEVTDLDLDGHAGIYNYVFVSNVTSFGRTLRVCDVYKPDIWEINLAELRRINCRGIRMRDAEVPTGIYAGRQDNSVYVTLYKRGVTRLDFNDHGCYDELCQAPSLQSQTLVLVDKEDGILGDHHTALMNPVAATVNPLDPRVIFFVDAVDGWIFWTNVTGPTEEGYELIHPANLLWTPNAVDHAPRAMSRSASLNRILVADWANKSLAALERHVSNNSITLTHLLSTPGNPFDMEASLGSRMVVWTEPQHNRLMQVTWNTAAETTELLVGRPVVGVVYSEYFGRVYATNPRAGEILSVSPSDRSGSSILHFSALNYAFTSLLRLLRPFYLISDENTGAIYFNVMPVPNISAYHLEDPSIFLTKDPNYLDYYMRVPSANYSGEGARNLASTIWVMKKRPFSTSLMYPPKPFYTNPDTLIHTVARHGSWLVFVETGITADTNFSARIVRLPLLSSTDESYTLNWRVRGPGDIAVILDWTDAVPDLVFAPIGAQNLWETNLSSEDSGSNGYLFGWIALSLLISNVSCAAVYNGCRKLRLHHQSEEL